jgi:hypothetical protein
MKKLLSGKFLTILLGVIAILALAGLAAGFSSFHLKPSEAFAVPQGPTPSPQPALPLGQPLPLAVILVWAALLLVLLAGLFLLLDREQRKRYLLMLLRLALLTAVVLLVISRLGLIPSTVGNEVPSQLAPAAQLPPGPAPAPEPFRAPLLPPWAVYLITLSLLLGFLAGGSWLLGRRRKDSETPPLGELASIARTALGEIQARKAWEDSIVQCYIRMSQTVSRRRDLTRSAAVTPSEFALRLESAGLPGPAVRQLTGLFERIRYGAKPPTQADLQSAVDCLTVILHACGESL